MRKVTVGVAAAVLALGMSPNPVVAHSHEAGAGTARCEGDTATCDPATSLSGGDVDFLKSAAEGDYFQIAVGQLAASRAADAGTAAFGTKLASDHTAALAVLKALATKYGVALPTAMSEEQGKELADAGGNSGLHFDDELVELEVSAHQQDISDFTAEASDGFNTDVRALAAASLPMLQAHLAAAEAANAAIEQLPGHEGDTASTAQADEGDSDDAGSDEHAAPVSDTVTAPAGQAAQDAQAQVEAASRAKAAAVAAARAAAAPTSVTSTSEPGPGADSGDSKDEGAEHHSSEHHGSEHHSSEHHHDESSDGGGNDGSHEGGGG